MIRRKYRLTAFRMTLDELVEAKRRGAKVRKHHPFGLTLEEYGHIYIVDGYKYYFEEDPAEIRRRLKEVK